jgi:FkbM family methyltransferase
VAELKNRLANLLLRYVQPLSRLRRVPVVGNVLSWTSRKLVPGESLVWVQIQAGPSKDLWIRVNPRTGQNVQKGIGEPEVQQALVDHLRPGMAFYDLGANIGFFSLMAARLVGPQGRVFSFEADPEIAARLRENLSRNQFSHAQVTEKAVWSESTTVFFARVAPGTSPDRGLGHVAPDSFEAGVIRVEAVSLDEFSQANPAPDFVKCDVEGAEIAVFEGATHLLSNQRPILLVEMHSPASQQTLLERFASLGFRCRQLDENHVLALPQ